MQEWGRGEASPQGRYLLLNPARFGLARRSKLISSEALLIPASLKRKGKLELPMATRRKTPGALLRKISSSPKLEPEEGS